MRGYPSTHGSSHGPIGSGTLASTPTLSEQLEASGLKATAQRLRIAEILLTRPVHMTAEQILVQLTHHGQRVSKATVYNTLNALTAHGLVREIHLGGDHTVYDSACRPHHHFHDEQTGELIDIPPDDVDFLKLPRLPEGMEAAGVEVVIRIRRRAG